MNEITRKLEAAESQKEQEYRDECDAEIKREREATRDRAWLDIMLANGFKLEDLLPDVCEEVREEYQ